MTFDDFNSALSWSLADVAPNEHERTMDRCSIFKRPRWIPLPALAAATEELWRTHRVNYGRPPSIADILDVCAKFRGEMRDMQYRLDNLGRTSFRLHQIVKATDDSYPPDDDEPKEPSKH